MIDVSVQFPEVGRIKIGERVLVKGSLDKTRPKALDYFLVTGTDKEALDNFIPDLAMTRLVAHPSCPDPEKPRKIGPLSMPVDSIEGSLYTAYAKYRASARDCVGNGHLAQRSIFDDNGGSTREQIDCSPEACPYAVEGSCKPTGVLSVMFRLAPVIGGCYTFRTKSINSVRTLQSQLCMYWQMTESILGTGRLMGIPLWLTMRDKSVVTRDGKKKTIHYVSLEFDGPFDGFIKMVKEMGARAATSPVLSSRRTQELLIARATKLVTDPEEFGDGESDDITEEVAAGATHMGQDGPTPRPVPAPATADGAVAHATPTATSSPSTTVPATAPAPAPVAPPVDDKELIPVTIMRNPLCICGIEAGNELVQLLNKKITEKGRSYVADRVRTLANVTLETLYSISEVDAAELIKRLKAVPGAAPAPATPAAAKPAPAAPATQEPDRKVRKPRKPKEVVEQASLFATPVAAPAAPAAAVTPVAAPAAPVAPTAPVAAPATPVAPTAPVAAPAAPAAPAEDPGLRADLIHAIIGHGTFFAMKRNPGVRVSEVDGLKVIGEHAVPMLGLEGVAFTGKLLEKLTLQQLMKLEGALNMAERDAKGEDLMASPTTPVAPPPVKSGSDKGLFDI